MSLIWIDGLANGDAEYNLSMDVAAAKTVFEETRLPILQIPAEEYLRFHVAVAELETAFRTI